MSYPGASAASANGVSPKSVSASMARPRSSSNNVAYRDPLWQHLRGFCGFEAQQPAYRVRPVRGDRHLFRRHAVGVHEIWVRTAF